MPMLSIADPRCYATAYPKTNIVINQALQVRDGVISSQELQITIANLLKKQQDSVINIALNLAPDLASCKIIYQQLHLAINSNHLEDGGSCLFAIPVILVCGSKKKAKLVDKIDTNWLNQFFIENNLIDNNIDWFISGKLIDQQQITKIKPSQFYYWVRNIKNAKLWLPVDLEPSAVEVINEGVFLRFLIGVAVPDNNPFSLSDIINFNKYNKSSIYLMQYLVSQLKTDGVTLFPIPFAPIHLSSSFVEGDNYRKEIAIQVALSNIIRKIRENNLTPVIYLSGASRNAVEIKTISKEPSELSEVSLWHLNWHDELDHIITKLISLIKEIGVEYKISS